MAVCRIPQGPAAPSAYLSNMKALVLGLLTAMAVAVCGIVVLEGGDETAIAVVWLLAAFVVLDLVTLVFVTVAGLWNVRRRALRRPIRAVLLSAYLVIAPLGYLYGGSEYAQQVAEYDPSADCRNLLGSCTPSDGRPAWLVLWAIFGLLSWAAAILHARWRRERYWYANLADPRYA